MKIVEVNSSHIGKQLYCINCPDGAHPLCEYGVVDTDGIKFYCKNNTGSARLNVTHVIESTKEINMKGFIEVTPMNFEPSCDSYNPFDGEYKPSDKKVIININSITFIEGSFIKTNILMHSQYGDSEYSTRVLESYEQIKELIKQAQ